MPLVCNIDRRGRRVRLWLGSALAVGGALLAALVAWPGGSLLAWIASVVLIGGGIFAIVESRLGWCAARAMGINTPI